MKSPGLAGQQRKPPTWLITGLIGSGAVAYALLVFLPGQTSIGELRDQVQERHQQIMQAQSIARPIALAEQRLGAARQVSHDWRSAAPRAATLSTHLAAITHEAEAAGVKLERLDPTPPVEMNLVAQQNVSVQFTGTFAAAFDLLRRLESLPGTNWVRDLRLSADASTTNLKGELTLTIFVDRADYSD